MPLRLSPVFSISLSHTHTHTHAHVRSLSLSLSLSVCRSIAILFGYPCRVSRTVRMDCCVKGALEKSPLTSAFPSFQTIRHRRRLLFIPFLLLSCLRDAPSKGALCLKEILSSILSACSRIARSNDFIARPKTPGLQTLGIFGIYLRDFR